MVIIALSQTIQPQFTVEYLRCSNQQKVWVILRQNYGRKGLTDVTQILTRSGRDMGLSYAKEIVSMSSAFRAQCTNVTDIGFRQADHEIAFSAMSPTNTNNNNRGCSIFVKFVPFLEGIMNVDRHRVVIEYGSFRVSNAVEL